MNCPNLGARDMWTEGPHVAGIVLATNEALPSWQWAFNSPLAATTGPTLNYSCYMDL